MSDIATCPKCERSLRVPATLMGQRVKCPGCATTFTAGEAPEDEAPAPRPSSRASGNPEAEAKRSRRSEPDEDEDERPARRSRRERDDEDEDDRGSRRRRRERDDEEDDRPSRRRYDDDEDEERRPRSLKPRTKPGKVQAIAIMTLIGGIWAILVALGLIGGTGCLALFWPGTYYAIVAGVMAIVKGAQLLGEEGYRSTVPSTIGIMLIICIVNCDVVTAVLGILVLVFCNDEEAKGYFRG